MQNGDGKDDQVHTQQRDERAARIDVECAQQIGAEGAGDKAFADHHRQRHEQRGPAAAVVGP